MQTEIDTYTSTAKWLHWIMAVLILTLLAVGFYVADLPRGPEKTQLIQIHKAAGTVALLLVIVRLGWRFKHLPPVLPEQIPELQKKLAHAVHWIIYFLMVAQPLSGWAVSSARGFPVALAGFIPLPPLVGKDEALAEAVTEIHEFFGWSLAILLIGHIAMAVKHQLIDRDNLMKRMLP